MERPSLGWTLLAYALAGLVPALTQRALDELDPYTLVAGRQLLLLLLLLALGRACGFGIAEPRRLEPGEWLRLCAAAWCGITFPALWLAHGIARSGAGHAAAVAPLAPLLVLTLAPAAGAPLARGLALALGGAGLLVLVANGESARGDLWLILGSGAAALYPLAAGPLAARHSPQRVALWASALSLLPLLLLAAAAPTRSLPGPAALAWLALLAAACGASGVAAWLAVPGNLQPGPRTAWAGVEAAVGLAAAALALGERPGGGAALATSALAAAAAWAAQPASGAAAAPLRTALPMGLATLQRPGAVGRAEPELLAPAPPPVRLALGAGPRAERPRPVRPRELARLHDVVAAARERLPPPLWQALLGAAETEHSAARNRRALDELALRPRVLRDVSQVDAGVAALRGRLRIPVVLAPLAGPESLTPAGALACAEAAREFGTAFVQSSLARPELETTAGVGAVPHVFQIHVQGDAGWLDAQVERALAAGCAGVCLSTECAAAGRLEREPPAAPWPARRAADAPAAALSWKYVEHYKQRFRLPLLLKGIATAQDALRACELGVDVIYVSNHGGRQLDHARAAAAALPEVADAVGDRAQLWVDGGFSRGTDVVKALALGAHVVAIGRLQAYGLAAAGAQGVLRVLELLEEELCTALALLGVSRPEQLDRSYLERCDALAAAHVLGAFPLLEPPGEPGAGG